jgi:DNA-binding Xre family transcriptional regulator
MPGYIARRWSLAKQLPKEVARRVAVDTETVTHRRRRGHRVVPELFERAMIQRALEGQHLAKLTGLTEMTISRIRRGEAVDRATLLRVADALEKAPVNAMLAELTGS